jgi:predicted kinase
MLPEMPILIITRGLPASGKTTYARNWVAQAPAHRARVNRDDLRMAMFGQPMLDHAGESAVSVAQQAQVRALLAAGRSVIVDDTNLRAKYARAWADLAAEAGAEFGAADFPTPLEECLRRDAGRDAAVGEDVIRRMYARHIAGGCGFAPIVPTIRPVAAGEIYVPDIALPAAWIFDVDGTLALRREGSGQRGPYDWARVGEDLPNDPVIRLAQALGRSDLVIAMSGRDECCREQTAHWLEQHVGTIDALLMRPAGDTRKDAIVKRELFQQQVAPKWQVLGVIDDRQQVVDMWRAMGLTCLQVAPGRF